MDQPGDTLELAAEPGRSRRRRTIAPVLGYLFAAACLVWLFHDLDFGELFRSMTGIHWGWVALAIAFDILSYLCQGWRWELILRPVGRISALRATQAIYVGLFTNEILPMRVGELVRAYLMSRWMSLNFAAVVPSMVVERFFDGVWLAASVGVTVILVPLPTNLAQAADVLGMAVLAATAVFIYVVVRSREAGAARARGKLAERLPDLLGKLGRGLGEIGKSRYFYAALGLSSLPLLGQMLAYWLIMRAYGLRLSFWIGAVVLLIVHLGTTIPNAPANVGTYQFFTVVGLTLFGVDKNTAAGFSLVVFVLLTVPLWALGSLALSRSGTSLAVLRTELKRWE